MSSSATHPAFSSATESPPKLRFWNRSFMALVVAPEPPFGAWFAAFDREAARAPAFFRGRPVVVDLSAAVAEDGPAAGLIVIEGLEARGLRLVALEGAEPALFAGSRWAGLVNPLPGRNLAIPTESIDHATPAAAASLLIDRPVRSGQAVVFEDGDVTVVGSVASGAEVIAGGSIHVYGALRGRAIAGVRTGAEARIFCRRLEAEFVGVDRLYRVAEHWGPALHGRAVQVFSHKDALSLRALD